MEVIFMFLDILIIFFSILYTFRFIRAFFMRRKLIKQIKRICKDRKHRLLIHRSPLASLFRLSKKTDLSVDVGSEIYHVKFITALSHKKIYHFVDRHNYITYLKIYFALPFAAKADESLLFSKFRRFKTDMCNLGEKEKYVLLFNPVPNDITYIDQTGTSRVAGNGTVIDGLHVYNAKGFCELINCN